MKLLVVDDEMLIVDLIKNHFEFEGYDVLEAFDGAEGVEKTLSEKPDIIILDINMPRMNGLDACRKLKESPETKHIPIIMLSAFAQADYIEKGRALGAAMFVTKPFSLDNLTEVVAKTLNAPKNPPA